MRWNDSCGHDVNANWFEISENSCEFVDGFWGFV